MGGKIHEMNSLKYLRTILCIYYVPNYKLQHYIFTISVLWARARTDEPFTRIQL